MCVYIHIYMYISIVAEFTLEDILKSSIMFLKLNLCLAVGSLRVLFNGPAPETSPHLCA